MDSDPIHDAILAAIEANPGASWPSILRIVDGTRDGDGIATDADLEQWYEDYEYLMVYLRR
jgi:hypothetical protein